VINKKKQRRSRPFAMLFLLGVLKEHRKVEQLEKEVEKLTTGLQKVSAQLEASKAAPQVVNNR